MKTQVTERMTHRNAVKPGNLLVKHNLAWTGTAVCRVLMGIVISSGAISSVHASLSGVDLDAANSYFSYNPDIPADKQNEILRKDNLQQVSDYLNNNSYWNGSANVPMPSFNPVRKTVSPVVQTTTLPMTILTPANQPQPEEPVHAKNDPTGNPVLLTPAKNDPTGNPVLLTPAKNNPTVETVNDKTHAMPVASTHYPIIQQQIRSAYYDKQISALNAEAEENHAEVLAESHSRMVGDARTLSQANDYTNKRFSDLKSEVNDNKDQANAGTASALAATGIPQVETGSDFMVGAGAGTYGNQSAIAVGISGHLAAKTVTKLAVSGDTNSGFGASAGIGWNF